jgi:Histidine kinase-like ATPase domain
MQFHFSGLHEIAPIVQFIAAQCPHPQALEQGLSELMINAVEHGNLGIRYDEKSALLLSGEWHNEIARRLALPQNQHKCAVIEYAATTDAIALTIYDQGDGFDWRPYMAFAPERGLAPNGRGIAIAASLAIWRIEYQGVGNRVVCKIPL